MKAALFQQFGDASQIKIEEVPERQIKSVDEAIDGLVYGLTEEDVRIVEGKD